MKHLTRRPKFLVAAPALLAATGLALAGCAQAPGTSDPAASTTAAPSASGSAAGFKACMVSDSGGFDDKSFNQTSYKGLTDAKDQLGIQTGEVESATTADFAKNIQSMVDANCNIIVTVGFLLADDTLAAAKKNTDIKFAIVDSNDAKFSRKELVLALVNKDGGAHLDRLNEKTHALVNGNSAGFVRMSTAGGPSEPIPTPIYASVRTVAEELLLTLRRSGRTVPSSLPVNPSRAVAPAQRAGR